MIKLKCKMIKLKSPTYLLRPPLQRRSFLFAYNSHQQFFRVHRANGRFLATVSKANGRFVAYISPTVCLFALGHCGAMALGGFGVFVGSLVELLFSCLCGCFFGAFFLGACICSPFVRSWRFGVFLPLRACVRVFVFVWLCCF